MQEIQNKIVAANLTKAQNYLLRTIILIFEINIIQYFNLLENVNNEKQFDLEILDGSAFIYFKKALELWENIKNLKENKNKFNVNNKNDNLIHFDNNNINNYDENNEGNVLYPFILKLYLVTYLRIYIEKYVSINYLAHEKYEFKNINKLLSNNKSKKIFVLKLFIMKVLKEKHLKSWDALHDFDFNKHQMNWKYEAKELVIPYNDDYKPYTLLLDLNKFETYIEIQTDLKIIIGQNYKIDANEFFGKIKDENFNLFLDAIVNNVFGKLTKEKNEKIENTQFLEFIEYVSKNFEKLNITNKNLVSEAFKNLSLNFFPSVFNLSNKQAEIFETHFVLFKYYLILLNAQKDTLFAIP